MNPFDVMIQNDLKLNKERIYEHLLETPYLYPSGTLKQLTKAAKTKSQCESILEHMYRHDTLDIEPYRVVEKTIIDRYYERSWIK